MTKPSTNTKTRRSNSSPDSAPRHSTAPSESGDETTRTPPYLVNELLAGKTILTPTVRGAELIRHRYTQYMQANSEPGWQSPTVLPWRVWLSSFYLLAMPDAPAMLSSEQASLLWEQIVSEEKDISIEQVSQFTRLAADAWATQHLWRISVAQLNMKNSSFEVGLYAKWQRQFIERCQALQVTDCYQSLGHLESVFNAPATNNLDVGKLKTENLLVGYPRTPPLLTALAPYCWTIRSVPRSTTRRQQNHKLCSFADEADELQAAVAWAVNAKLAAPGKVVAIALSNTNMLRDAVQQGIRRYITNAELATDTEFGSEDDSALEPSSSEIPETQRSKHPLDDTAPETTKNLRISLAKQIATVDLTPLGHTKLLQSALRVLRFSGPVSCDDLSAILLDPYLGDWAAERAARTLLDRDIRANIRELRLTEGFVLTQLRREEYGLNDFANKMQALAELRDAAPHRMNIMSWHEHFDRQLALFAWPNNKFVIDDEQIALDAWHHVLDAFVSLSAYTGICTRAHALHRLSTIIAQRNFEMPRSFEAIRVVAIDETPIYAPDAVAWCGLGQYQWPIATHINPLLPHKLQRKAGVPGSNAAEDSELALNSLNPAIDSVRSNRFSFSSRLGDIENLPIQYFDRKKDTVAVAATAHGAERFEYAIESKEDIVGLALASETRLKSAVRFFADQAACPFRAYAVHRLGSESIEEPKLGLDARRRGELVHLAIAALWSSLKSHEALIAQSEKDTNILIDAVVEKTVDDYRQITRQLPHYWHLEGMRLKHLLREWLEVERGRQPFEVAGIEDEFDAQVGQLHFKIRIDRIDTLNQDSLAVIDFKTGQDSRNSWAPPRIDQPQLPIYAVNFSDSQVAAVAYAQLRSGECKLVDLPKSVLSKEISDEDWQEQMREWRYDLYATAQQIEKGDARVDPKRGAATCRYCEQRLVCRISDARTDSLSDLSEGQTVFQSIDQANGFEDE